MIFNFRIRDVSPRLGAMFFSAKNGHESSGPSAEYGGENSSNVKAGGNHARLFVDMLESMVNMLGPDMDSFAELVFQLGAKHSSYGVKSVDFPIMGQGKWLNKANKGQYRNKTSQKLSVSSIFKFFRP
jgi:hypothetical protein